jgi:hypothetical protein
LRLLVDSAGQAPDLVLMTPHGATLWHPTESAALAAVRVDEALIETYLASDGVSMSKVLRAKITNKKRFVAFRRFWWHKIRQLQAEQGLRHEEAAD